MKIVACPYAKLHVFNHFQTGLSLLVHTQNSTSKSEMQCRRYLLKRWQVKCVRCWNYRPAVGANAAHPELCDRCVDAVA